MVSRFRGKLLKMIKDSGSKYDDFSISPKIRQILLQLILDSIDSIEKKNFINSANQCTKMSYYWFNRKEILQKAKERYSKKKLLSIIHKTWKQ